MKVVHPASSSGPAPLTELWLVRHGETEWSRLGRHTSHTDVPLTEAGEAAAREVGERLKATAFDLVLCSPRERARRTAKLAGFGGAEVVEGLTEWDYGEYEGLTTPEIRERVPHWTVWSHPCPGGESADDVGRRLDLVLARTRMLGGRVLVFGHGHASRALGMRWLGLQVTGGRLLKLDPTTISVLGHEHDQPAVARWNS
ncbi:histidine phosphatase family protein [Marmoricola sp. RAF53]|uniref:histidine phosphatase family protein n=1 Tax=Marmoricola sp. RAF53 TaxID=3233059 RepID=UPI003F9A0744